MSEQHSLFTDVPQFAGIRWRVGRKVGRTIYAQMEDGPSDYDALIGVMDSPLLAAKAVDDHNASLSVSGSRAYFESIHGDIYLWRIGEITPEQALEAIDGWLASVEKGEAT